MIDTAHYHGTAEAFDRFDPAHLGKHHRAHAGGFWLTGDIRVARAFAMTALTGTVDTSPAVDWSHIHEAPRWRSRWRLARRLLRRERRWGLVEGDIGLPFIPGPHWNGAYVLRVELDGLIHIGSTEATAPGIFGGGNASAAAEDIAAAKADGAAAVHWPRMLEGVGAALVHSPTTLVLAPEAARIVERMPLMQTLEPCDLEEARAMAREELNFWAAESVPDCKTHLPCDDGSPWSVYCGDLWASCGTEWGSDAALVTGDEEPTCDLCADLWRAERER